MHFFFMDTAAGAYDPETPGQRALGGTQAATAYLSAALVRQGAQVTLFNNSTSEQVVKGVHVLPPGPKAISVLQEADIMVMVGMPVGQHVKQRLQPKCPMVLWSHLATEQKMTEPLAAPAEQAVWDAFVNVSEWHRQDFVSNFKLPSGRVHVIGNAVAPFFQDLSTGPAWFETGAPPTLVYSSAPYRGLQVLLDVFPMIRAAIPDVQLKVFSGLQMYPELTSQGEDVYRFLYELARALPGVTYGGVVPQNQLAQELLNAAAFTYPAIISETACISAMEAMALGAEPLTTDIGALRETAAGFGRTIPARAGGYELLYEYSDMVIAALKDARENPARAAENRRRQIAYVQENYVWEARAKQWIALAEQLVRKRG